MRWCDGYFGKSWYWQMCDGRTDRRTDRKFCDNLVFRYRGPQLFCKRYKGSFMSKRRFKADAVEHKMMVKLPWTDSYKELNKNTISLKLSLSRRCCDLQSTRNRFIIFWERYKGSLTTKKHCIGDTVEHKVVANFPWTDS